MTHDSEKALEMWDSGFSIPESHHITFRGFYLRKGYKQTLPNKHLMQNSTQGCTTCLSNQISYKFGVPHVCLLQIFKII